jgi:hypothetical protein
MADTVTSEKKGSGGFKSSRGHVFGTVEQVFDDVWWAWGTTRFMPLVLIPRNMVVVRERGELIVVHPVLLPEAEQAKIDALGPVKHIVRLGAFHGMDDAEYVKRYKPKVWAPPGVDHAPGVTTDHELVPGGELPLAGATLFAFERSKTAETVLHLERHDGLLLTCDSVQNWETTAGCSLLGGFMSRRMGFKGRACIGPGWRGMSEPKDGTGFRDAFEKLLELDFRHAIGGHGLPITQTAKQDLRREVERVYAGARR